MTATHSIFIRTYYKDAIRLDYTLRSIQKFCSGFDRVIVACQETSIPAIRAVTEKHSFVELHPCPFYENDFIGQQITKMRAFLFTDTDFIFHIDSDCVFYRPCTPANFFGTSGSPFLYHREYDYFYRDKRYMPWQFVTSRFLNQQVDYEFMALFPLVYPRQLYIDLERWFIDENKMCYEDIEGQLLLKSEFSEFNLMGAFSFYKGPNIKYHEHRNWGFSPPEFYVRQLATKGQREDRTILNDELNELVSIVG